MTQKVTDPHPDIAPPTDETGLARCDSCGRYGWHSTDRCPTTARINPYPDVAPPAGTEADDWSDDDQPIRVVSGAPRPVDVHRATLQDLTTVRVYTHAVQLADGSLSQDPSHGGPGVSLDTIHDGEDFASDSSVDLSPDDARASGEAHRGCSRG